MPRYAKYTPAANSSNTNAWLRRERPRGLGSNRRSVSRENVLETNRDAPLRVYAVWFNMYPGDEREHWRTDLLIDARVRLAAYAGDQTHPTAAEDATTVARVAAPRRAFLGGP